MQKKLIQTFIKLALIIASLGVLSKRVTSQNVSLANHTDIVWSLAFTTDSNGNSLLISSSIDKNINVWSKTNSSNHFTLIDQFYSGGGHNNIVSLYDQTIATSCVTTIKVWNISDKTLIKTLTGQSGYIIQLAISPNQQMIASASVDNTSKVWNISSGECISTMHGHTDNVRSVVFYSNEILITGSFDKTIKIWNITNVPGTCVRTLTGHTSGVLSLLLLPNSLVGSGSFDESIKIWNVTNGTCLATLTGHNGGVRALVMLSNVMIASGSGDNRIKLWNLTSYSCLKVFFYFKNIFKILFYL
jgi:WD40 repeat protein